MKILFVTDLCPIREDEKGLPNTLLEFISDFKKLGEEAVLLRPNVVPNVLIRGRKILPTGIYNFRGIKCINKNFLTPFFNERQFGFLKNEKFDMVVSHMPSGTLAAKEISKILNVPYFAGIHASDIKILKDKKYSFIRKRAIKAYLGAKNILCRSYWIKDEIEKILPEVVGRCYVVPSGIESEKVISKNEAYKKTEKFLKPDLKIISAGKLIKRKNFKLLVEAINELAGVKLVVAGDGREMSTLKSYVRCKKLEQKVTFVGQKSREEIFNLMDENSVFVMLSEDETFGMVYLEAMARGCITICSEDSGMAGFIKDGFNGFLCKRDKQALVDLINKIKKLENPEYIIQNSLDTAISMDKLKMSENYLKLIQNILF